MKALDALAGLAGRFGISARVEDGEKCYAEIEEHRPYGGATTFEQVAQFEAASEVEYRLRDLAWKFDSIVSNIMADDDIGLDDKASRVERAARELRERVVTDLRDPMEGMAKDMLAHGIDAQFKSFDVPGGPYWAGIWSNNYMDRQNETFTEKSLREYVDTAKSAGVLPELMVWHIPGSRIGETLLMDVSDGGMAFAFGRYDSEQIAKAVEEWPEPLGMSHGLVFQTSDKTADGTYERFYTYELSVCPASYAANEHTAHQAIKGETPMALNAEMAGMLRGIIGEDRAKAIQDMVTEQEAKAAASGRASKADDPEPDTNTPAAAITTPDIEEAIAKALEPLQTTMGALVDVIVGMKATMDDQAAVIEDLQLDAETKAADLATPKNVRSLLQANRGRPARGAKADEARAEIEAGMKAAAGAPNVPAHLAPYFAAAAE